MSKAVGLCALALAAFLTGCGERPVEAEVARVAARHAATNHEVYVLRTLAEEHRRLGTDPSETAAKRRARIEAVIRERIKELD